MKVPVRPTPALQKKYHYLFVISFALLKPAVDDNGRLLRFDFQHFASKVSQRVGMLRHPVIRPRRVVHLNDLKQQFNGKLKLGY
jgi:hypothetical protein